MGWGVMPPFSNFCVRFCVCTVLFYAIFCRLFYVACDNLIELTKSVTCVRVCVVRLLINFVHRDKSLCIRHCICTLIFIIIKRLNSCCCRIISMIKSLSHRLKCYTISIFIMCSLTIVSTLFSLLSLKLLMSFMLVC